MTAPSCPDPAILRSFVRCTVSEQESQSISEHLERCPACDETVVGLERDSGTIAKRLERAAARPTFAQEPECQKILNSLLDRALPSTEELPAANVSLPAMDSLRDYRIVAKLGEGGMGTVYKAVHQRLKKTVALKVLPTRRIGDEPTLARFAREMEVLGQLNHPHIVQALDAGEHDGQHYLVMEYVEGWDLSELVKRCSPLSIADAAELVSQAALGLQYAHENGFVHRDIKPSNLMLARPDSRTRSTSPTLKILDLGLARVLDQQAEAAAPKEELTSTGQVMGTLDYMAPEQGGDAHQVDIRADIYSLGATFYKLLTGDSPFAEYAKCPPLQRLIAIAQNDPPNIRTKRPEVSKELAAIIHRMLAKNPDDRFDTPADVVTALAPFCDEADLAALWNAASGKSLGDNSLGGPSRLATSQETSRAPSQVKTSPQAQPLASGNRTGRRWPMVAVAASLAGALFLGVILLIPTPHGTLRVEIDDPSIEVSVKGTNIVLKQADADDIDLSAGVKTLIVKRGDLHFETEHFALTKNEVTLVKVELLRGEVRVVAANGTPLGSMPVAPAPTPVAKGTTPAISRKAPPLAIAPFDATQAQAHQEAWAKHLGTEVETINSVGAKFVLIPPGEFLMGSSAEELELGLKIGERAGAHPHRLDDMRMTEVPQHRVVITKPFFLGQTEVTIGEYKKFAAATGYKTFFERANLQLEAEAAKAAAAGTPDAVPPYRYPTYLHIRSISEAEYDNLPITAIKWDDAQAYCKWLSVEEGVTYRLPSEAEWEYACRAGSTTQFWFGDDEKRLTTYAWFKENSHESRPVGIKLPNPFGLHDMHGNVLEWCHDFFDPYW